MCWWPGVCFTNVLRALQDILLKFVYCRNRSSYENFKLKLCTCAQSMALGTRTRFQFEILTINVISSIVYFRKIILESSRNVSETTPWLLSSPGHQQPWYSWVPWREPQQPMTSQFRGIIEKANLSIFSSVLKNSAHKGVSHWHLGNVAVFLN